MADVIITIKIMPESPETDLKAITDKTSEIVKGFGGEVGRVTEEPLAFGIKSLNIIFVNDESSGSTEPLEQKVALIEGVKSVEITDVRRAIG